MNDDNMDESQKYPAKQKKPYQNNKTTKQAKNPFIKKKTPLYYSIY